MKMVVSDNDAGVHLEMHGIFMDMALEQAMKALDELEVPVGCVVVRGGEVIAMSHNMTNANKSPLDHAEVVSIRGNDCSNSVFYVTCEPCIMCMGILCRIGVVGVYYGCRNQIFGSGSVCGVGVESVCLSDERCSDVLKEFYCRENVFAPEEKRKRKGAGRYGDLMAVLPRLLPNRLENGLQAPGWQISGT